MNSRHLWFAALVAAPFAAPGAARAQVPGDTAIVYEREVFDYSRAGNVTHAARLLKISRKGLQLKMKELGLREGAGEKNE